MARGIRLEELEDIARGALTPKMAAFYHENCIVCMDNQGHATGVMLDVDFNEEAEAVSVSWDGSVDERMRTAYADREKRVDFGACAIALLLMPVFSDLVAIRPSSKGNAIDYYLAPAGEEHLIFNNSAFLEVSGIQKENPSNTVAERIARKRKRLRDARASAIAETPDLPTYICIVEFGQPQARVVLE
jgi:hypothetical protein